ncbi:hypothetical protein Peur_009970 [Populus x canadensis]
MNIHARLREEVFAARMEGETRSWKDLSCQFPNCLKRVGEERCDAVLKLRGGTWLAGPSTISMTLPISPQLVRCCEDVLPLRWANLLNDRLYALKFLHMC